MTCQWCIHYRRRSGKALCANPATGGKVIRKRRTKRSCPFFFCRQICTTCQHRCTPMERSVRMGTNGNCSMWNMREIETWGGNRRWPGWRSKSISYEAEQAEAEARALAASDISGAGTVPAPAKPKILETTYV